MCKGKIVVRALVRNALSPNCALHEVFARRENWYSGEYEWVYASSGCFKGNRGQIYSNYGTQAGEPFTKFTNICQNSIT